MSSETRPRYSIYWSGKQSPLPVAGLPNSRDVPTYDGAYYVIGFHFGARAVSLLCFHDSMPAQVIAMSDAEENQLQAVAVAVAVQMYSLIRPQ